MANKECLSQEMSYELSVKPFKVVSLETSQTKCDLLHAPTSLIGDFDNVK